MRSTFRAALVLTLLLVSTTSFVWLGYRLGRLRANSSQELQLPKSPAGQLSFEDLPKSEIMRLFRDTWYYDGGTWEKNRWVGIETQQNPMDVWVTQEVMFDTKPDVVVECGSLYGGSAALWATILSQVNPAGTVISIDIEDRMDDARKLPIVKQRVRFLVGSSTNPAIVEEVARRVKGKRILLILDSLHTKEHVLNELRAYSPLVGVGSYIIVQDTNLKGPAEATLEFLASNKSFLADRSRERLLLTFNQIGFLRRIS